MGTIINLRGTAGSGKTELARRVMGCYGWPAAGQALSRPGRLHPLAWRLNHPHGRHPLVVLGHYGRTVGGCDTIALRDGGLAGALDLAGEFASTGNDVLLEGLDLSRDVTLTRQLARRHSLHVLWLATPLDDCARRLLRRYRRGATAAPMLVAKVMRQYAATASACELLDGEVSVRHLPFDPALHTALTLLGIPGGSPFRPLSAPGGASSKHQPASKRRQQ